MAQKRCLLLHTNDDQAKELTRELFVRGWDVVDSDSLSEHELDVDVAVLVWPSSTAMVKAYQHGFDKFLAKRDGLMLVVPDPAGEHIDLTECTLTNASLVHVDTINELATYINGLPIDDGMAPAVAPPARPDTSVSAILREMAATFEERNAVYGNNYLRVAPVIRALWPDGVPAGLVTEDRWHLFELVIVKLTRFARGNLTHIDSIHDAAVYAAMIESDIRRNG